MVSTFPSTPVQIELGEEEFYHFFLGHAYNPGAAQTTGRVFWWGFESTNSTGESQIVVKRISGITRFRRADNCKHRLDVTKTAWKRWTKLRIGITIPSHLLLVLFVPLFIYSNIHSLMHSPTHPLIHILTHLPTHPPKSRRSGVGLSAEFRWSIDRLVWVAYRSSIVGRVSVERWLLPTNTSAECDQHITFGRGSTNIFIYTNTYINLI